MSFHLPGICIAEGLAQSPSIGNCIGGVPVTNRLGSVAEMDASPSVRQFQDHQLPYLGTAAPKPVAATRVMVVSDDRQQAARWSTGLCAGGFDVVETSGLSEALGQMDKGPADVILADSCLPEDGALSLCRQMCSRGFRAIVVMGSDDPIDRIVAVEIGADDQVARDINTRELVARIRAIARPARGSKAPLPPAPWRANPSTRSLQAPNGQIVALSETEWELLLLLAHAAGQPIYADSGEIKFGSLTRDPGGALRGAISRLRRKLKNKLGTAPITSYYGSGYTLDVQIQMVGLADA